MGNHPPQRKLRRSFGSQPVGCFGGPRQPEAGVGVQVTQAQSSRWTFLSSDDGDLATWRLGDLATWRLGDLAIWRSGDLAIWRSGDLAIWRSGDLANPVAGDHGVPTRALFSGVYLGLSSAFRKNVERFASGAPQDHAKPSLPRATIQACPQISPLRIVL